MPRIVQGYEMKKRTLGRELKAINHKNSSRLWNEKDSRS